MPSYFDEWLTQTRLEETRRQKSPPTEFKLGASGEDDPEAWEQWIEFVEWVADGQPDAMDSSEEPEALDEDEFEADDDDDEEDAA